MLQILQSLFGFLLIIFIVPQTPTENIVLRKILDTGYFGSYNEAKKFVKNLTWFLILIFLSITFVGNF